AEIVRRYLDLVYSVALRCAAGDRHLAEDIAQEVFVLVGRRAVALSRHQALAGWLHTTTRYQAIHAVRRERRRRERERKVEAMNEPLRGNEPDFDWEKLRPLLDAATDQLSAADRDAVLMRFYLRRSFREISVTLGLREDAARRRVERALEKLRRTLARRGLASTGAALAGALSAQAVSAAPPGLAGAALQGALTAGPGGGPLAAAWLQFMATSKTVAVAGGIVLLAAATLTVHEFQLAGQGEAAIPAATRALAEAQHRLESLPTPLAAAPAPSASSPGAPPSRAAVVSAHSGGPTSVNDTSLQSGAPLEAEYPEIRRADLAWFKAQIDSQYRQFFADRKLSPEQIAQFEQIQLSEGLTHGVNQYSFQSTDTPVSAPQAQAELLDLLGADGVQALQSYDRDSNARQFVAMVGKNAFDGGDPLTGDQTIALAKLVGSAGRGPASIDLNALSDQAGPLLNANQLAALVAAAQQARFNVEFRRAVRADRP
ncbi:MAG TPA: sigma-70 family RNA polymerase sigma factor, partial [Opitutaceae bacterium]|nr:sigma-70 family RNA polymerase sigma factor [Opitutaceae bacterium]